MVWQRASERLHSRVLEGARDALARDLTQLHRPTYEGEAIPTCLGCDRDLPGGPGAVWPCRTYTLIARTVLCVADVEAVLTGLRAEDGSAAETAH